MPQPAIGCDIKIVTTHVISPKWFYAQLCTHAAKMREIELKMNAPEFVSAYKPLRQMPGIMELVLSRYTDGRMYRAQVIELVDDQVMVFYVDYGNMACVALDELAHWDDRFDFLPFQAYRMCLDEMFKCIDEPRTAEQFKRLVLNKELTAHVK